MQVRKIAGILLFVMIVGSLIISLFFGSKKTKEKNLNREALSSPSLTSVSSRTEVKKDSWIYDNRRDVMTGKIEKVAYVQSTNTLSLGFPYQGEQRATLMIRQDPRLGLNVMLSIEKGQFMAGVRGVEVLAKFDQNPPIAFSAVGPSDHSSTTLFINNEQKFLSRLKKTKTLYLSTPIYREGEPPLLFDVANLLW